MEVCGSLGVASMEAKKNVRKCGMIFFYGSWRRLVDVRESKSTSMEVARRNFHGSKSDKLSWNLMEPHGTNTFVSTSMKVEACIYFHGSSWKLHGSAAQVLPWK